MVETERRFLLKFIPPQIKSLDPLTIEDYMLLTGEPHPHLRLRRLGDKYELTKKYPINKDDILEMIEETIYLEPVEFETIKKLPNTGQTKKRFKFKDYGYTAEVDLWEGKLKGLGIVEFEFKDVATAKAFMPPDYCLIEVTQEEWLAGGKLSGRTYSDISKELTKLGYIKLS